MQPWKHSTVAKTVEPKAISLRNTYKNGFRQTIKELRAELYGRKNALSISVIMSFEAY